MSKVTVQSIFADVESFAETTEAEVVTAFNAAWTEIEDVWTDDVKPIIKATLQYIETNGASDLLKIAETVFTSAIASGGNYLDVLAASVGTVLDEAKNAGISVAEGAAHLAVSMVAAKAATAATATNTAAPEAAADADAEDEDSDA